MSLSRVPGPQLPLRHHTARALLVGSRGPLSSADTGPLAGHRGRGREAQEGTRISTRGGVGLARAGCCPASVPESAEPKPSGWRCSLCVLFRTKTGRGTAPSSPVMVMLLSCHQSPRSDGTGQSPGTSAGKVGGEPRGPPGQAAGHSQRPDLVAAPRCRGLQGVENATVRPSCLAAT